MSLINFTSLNKEVFTIGSISFNFLNERNVFDEFQEDFDITSDVILSTTGEEKLVQLSDKIKLTVEGSGIRPDLNKKLIFLAEFIKTAEQITVTID